MEVIQLRGKVGCPGILQIKKKKNLLKSIPKKQKIMYHLFQNNVVYSLQNPDEIISQKNLSNLL